MNRSRERARMTQSLHDTIQDENESSKSNS